MSGDGWSDLCAVETGYTCSGGSTSQADTCTEIWGDGLKMSTSSSACDDGDTDSGDGWSSSWIVETGFVWTGGSSTTADSWSDIWGDGFVYLRSPATFCDDDNTVSGDGWSSSCSTETGYTWTGGSTSSPDTCIDTCNDGVVVMRNNANYWDDGNADNTDGWRTNCDISDKWSCSGGTSTTPDTCIDICGDGFVVKRNTAGYWDDGNSQSGDGWDSGCQTETYWQCNSGTGTTPDTCTDICGDGKVVKRETTDYWDDGNTNDNDGCSSTCATESKWSCSGGTATGADTWGDLCGDGYVKTRDHSTYCDDDNTVSGDGWSSTCVIETGYSCLGGNSLSSDKCTPIWGDGILIAMSNPIVSAYFSSSLPDATTIAGFEEWDDGNNFGIDGWDASCKVEANYNWIHDFTQSPNTEWGEIWGDGLRTTPDMCDDGNNISGDGWSSTWAVENGYQWEGGSSTGPDTCGGVCGDGIYLPDLEGWDDGNQKSVDGWSSDCIVEAGYVCVTPPGGGPQICSEICGDGKRFTSQWDDGNTKSNDGCSSTCTIEPGFICSGGTATRKDTWTEIWGDGKDYGSNECEDGNFIDGDGWSSSWEYETWYAWTGGTPTSIDSCFTKYISVTEFAVSSTDSTVYLFTFNDTMDEVDITQNDMIVSIDSSYLLDYDWSAKYISNQQLAVTVDVVSVLTGLETMTINFTNPKKYRTNIGGCLTKYSYSITMTTNLQDSVDQAKSMGFFSQFFTYSGLFIIGGVILVLGGSLEMLWSLINTLQIISYLPLITSYFPEHVRVMYGILELTNLDIDFMANLFKKITTISNIDVGIKNSRFTSNGIESPLFLNNAASLILSFWLYCLVPLLLLIAIFVFRCNKIKKWLHILLTGYFFNNFLRFFTEGYLEITFAAVLNVNNMSFGTIQEASSLIIAVLVSILSLVFPFMAAALLYDKKKAIAR